MLQLKNIVKTYVTGELKQDALKGVSISFRENEFVSILGQSGSGKTTMLNIIGGLDRYTSGDLIIGGVSTEKYRDADWDYYRNNSIGFVFQSYNLIPHQSVLANVEMALTLAGVSKKERRQRAITVLKKVGLGDHIHKKPNQMSGGQMQRVAIARALINNPDILLADEPTGALDSETSVQIMELLKEIAKDKLVIMVTHNPELAEQYSTRIVRLKDGVITDDSNPYEEEEKPAEVSGKKKISMSFFTALALSFNNLRTKKGRTILTAFAGSIGIIGIALILAVSTGMSDYISNIQKDTMASYPITISSETMDLSGIMGQRQEMLDGAGEEREAERSAIYADYTELKSEEMLTSSLVENNLTEFKKYLDDDSSEIHQYIGENGIVYTYSVSFSVYSYDKDGKLVDSDSDAGEASSGDDAFGSMMENRQTVLSNVMGNSAATGASNFSELMAGADKSSVSTVVTDNYDLLYGSWPENYDEVVLVLDRNNGIPVDTLYQLGLITADEYNDAAGKIEEGEDEPEISFDYADACGHVFYLVPACDKYEEGEDGLFSAVDETMASDDRLIEDALQLKVTGIIKPAEDADSTSITTSVAYTSKLTDYIISHTDDSAVIKAQEAQPDTNVLTGMEFEAPDDDTKAEDAKEYISAMGVSDKASLYQMMMYYGQSAGADAAQQTEDTDAGQDAEASQQAAAMAQQAGEATQQTAAMATDETSMAAALDAWLAGEPDQDVLLKFYDQYIAGATYEDNMEAFGKVSYDAPSSISIYTDSFENKEKISDCIESYNKTADEDAQITYTDYVALLTSSVTTIINGISYVLIAFVAISLVVSCIMIGIITHISVMERTKEIGILRALGASKRNISQVFNAETFIIGCCAGVLGIVLSLIAIVPINKIIQNVSGIEDITAKLSVTASVVLILISIVITIIGGLFPAKKAAKKDPVVALRTE